VSATSGLLSDDWTPPLIVVEVRGGAVQDIYTNALNADDPPFHVLVVDWDSVSSTPVTDETFEEGEPPAVFNWQSCTPWEHAPAETKAAVDAEV